MFTGIVQEVGKTKERGPSSLTIQGETTLKDLQEGESVAVNGACLTVKAIGQECFSVDTMQETLRRTNLGLLKAGDYVNLERAITLNSPLGGHLVQGHVDATGSLLEVRQEEDALLMKFQASSRVMRYVVEKGFIAVDGISLTVVSCNASTFSVSVVKYTQDNTNLGRRRPGEVVNLEVDILAKYVEKLLSSRNDQGN